MLFHNLAVLVERDIVGRVAICMSNFDLGGYIMILLQSDPVSQILYAGLLCSLLSPF